MSRRGVLFGLVVAGLLAAGLFVVVLVRSSESRPVTGDLVAYGCKEQKNPWYAICTVRSDGAEMHRLTDGLATTDAAWSPDGRLLAFTHHETGEEFQRFTEDDLYVLEVEGGGVRQVTVQRPGESSFDPAWSPTGDELAFLRSDDVASDSPARFGRLAVVSVEEGQARLVGGRDLVADPDWSPDGREIAVALPTLKPEVPTLRNTDIYAVDVATGRRRALVETPNAFETSPAWSPDGSRLAFARWRSTTQFDGEASIHVMRSDGSGEREVLAHRHYASGPFNLSWSPDGTELAFETSPSVLCLAISVLVVDTGKVRPLTTCSRPRESAVAPTWQPAPEQAD
jgi:Tol biopolymer transport system component